MLNLTKSPFSRRVPEKWRRDFIIATFYLLFCVTYRCVEHSALCHIWIHIIRHGTVVLISNTPRAKGKSPKWHEVDSETFVTIYTRSGARARIRSGPLAACDLGIHNTVTKQIAHRVHSLRKVCMMHEINKKYYVTYSCGERTPLYRSLQKPRVLRDSNRIRHCCQR